MRHRGRTHTTLTEPAEKVVHALKKIRGVKMIAPGVIDPKGGKYPVVTAVFTTAGFELSIGGNGIQKVAVHCTIDPYDIYTALQKDKTLRNFTFKSRERKPGI